jgi:hypothetical protein
MCLLVGRGATMIVCWPTWQTFFTLQFIFSELSGSEGSLMGGRAVILPSFYLQNCWGANGRGRKYFPRFLKYIFHFISSGPLRYLQPGLYF